MNATDQLAETDRWLRYAEEDLITAETLLGQPHKVWQGLEGAFNAVNTMRLGESPNSIFRLVFSEQDFSPIDEQLRADYSHS